MSIRWANLHKYSLVWVEFGNRKVDIECHDRTTYEYGINMGHEFCYRHMAVVVSNNIKADVIAVVPLTSYRDGDENYITNVVINVEQYGYIVKNKTTIKIGHIRNIDKKRRIKQIIKPFISKTLQLKINEAIKKSFE